MDFKLVAFVEALVTVILVPLVASDEDARNHPEVFANVTEVKPVQFLNAALPMLVTVSGIVIEVKPLQPWNAEDSMLVTPLPIDTEVKPVQP